LLGSGGIANFDRDCKIAEIASYLMLLDYHQETRVKYLFNSFMIIVTCCSSMAADGWTDLFNGKDLAANTLSAE
jgi:hypothetical protein